MKSRNNPRSSQDSRELQQVIIRIDREKYRRLRIKLIEHGQTVTSFIREKIDEAIS